MRAPGPALSWSRRNGRLVRLESEPAGSEVWSEVAGPESTRVAASEAESLAGKTVTATCAVARAEGEISSAAAGWAAGLAATACRAGALSSAETLEGVTTGLSALRVDTGHSLPDASGLLELRCGAGLLCTGNSDSRRTGNTVSAWSSLREVQTVGRVFHVGNVSHVLRPGGLLSRAAVREAAAGGCARGVGVDYTMASLEGGGMGVGYEMYTALGEEGWAMAVRLDSMDTDERQVLWAELAPGWRDNLAGVQQRLGEPGWKSACVVGPRECTLVDASEYVRVAMLHAREQKLRELRHDICLALASEEAYLQKEASHARSSASVRRARRRMEDRAPGPYQGVALHAVAEHLLGVGSAVSADTLRAVGPRDALDDPSLNSTSSSSSSDTCSDEALRSGRDFSFLGLSECHGSQTLKVSFGGHCGFHGIPAAVLTGEVLDGDDDGVEEWEGSDGEVDEDWDVG